MSKSDNFPSNPNHDPARDEARLRAALPIEIHPRLRSARIVESRAVVVAEAGDLGAKAREELEGLIESALGALDGIEEVRVALIADRRRRMIIAVGSGKGGVGKSTLASNLAVALARQGRRVGLVDADILGPSQVRMMGATKGPVSRDGKTMEPVETHGVKMISIGLMVDPDQALVWRGPMVTSALMQLLFKVEWGELDVLLLDLPPGTGDIQLTLSQKVKMTGALIVSTPQDVALLDAKKALDMFQKVRVPVLGLIENMSTYICPQCGHEDHVFGHGGVAGEAAALDLPFMGEIPLAREVRVAGDDGTPIAAGEGKVAEAYARLAAGLVEAGIG